MTLFSTFNYRAADNKNDLIVDPNPGVVMLVGRKLLQVVELQKWKFTFSYRRTKNKVWTA